jgi:hypothetical protein
VGKTGGNSFHGNLFHNYNDKIFNANTFFNNQEGLQEPRSDRITSAGRSAVPSRRTRCSSSSITKVCSTSCPTPAMCTIPSPQLETYTLAHIPAAATPLYQDAFKMWNGAPGAPNAVPTTNGNGPFQDPNNHLGLRHRHVL